MKQLTSQLIQYNLTLPQWYILAACAWDSDYFMHLIKRATWLSQSTGGGVNADQLEKALFDLVNRRYINQVTDNLRNALLSTERNLPTPIYGYPIIGKHALAHAGTKVFQSVFSELMGVPYWEEAAQAEAGGRVLIFTRTYERAVKLSSEMQIKYPDAVIGMQVIGAWRAQWWQYNESGYQLSIKVFGGL